MPAQDVGVLIGDHCSLTLAIVQGSRAATRDEVCVVTEMSTFLSRLAVV